MSLYSFQRHQRLLTPSQYKSVFDGADGRVSHSAFLLLATKTQPEQPARLGLIVAKKHLKRAVDRNGFKRVVRTQFRLAQHSLVGLDIVVLARPGCRELDSRQLAAEIEKYWPKLVRRCHNPSPDQPAKGKPRSTQ
ncbi:ribonuclease P protein component [Ketobacter alkanivorans]|uniref:Ribonuclease P protein component n=1 Tax=Ketobacter alkanivorans TaxID=1917421 RepID=A0A2K9LLG1_9GAMM|nr:ribonuclease P protein component [Ketobacter alkanivorans]AUM13067.1 ribonuclease P protein component [Ketobacter alkanivorans]